ncbi:MAG TPA: alginate lyase family protein [Allosphingosinicella sp.]|nr:alginate lyase family protein [Allosphingosinicella sp.]
MIGLRSVRRQIAFAWHVPPRQLLRRTSLSIRRRAETRLKPKLHPGPLRAAPDPPLPLFEPRKGKVSFDPLRFSFIGREITMPAGIDWQGRDDDPRDQLWRMNLHYMEYLEEAPDTFLMTAVADWIDANPPYWPGTTRASWNAYALSLRVVVWMQQLAHRRDRLPDAFQQRAARSIAEQIVYLERHLETDIKGNHLVKNIKALAWASAFFEGPAANRWRRKAIRLLERELDHQIPADGMHYELSPSYHDQVFADLVEIRAALGGDPLQGRLDEKLVRAAQVVADLAHPDGRAAQFGDSGLNMAYAPSDCLAAYRAIGGNVPEPRRVFRLEEAGYFGARDGGNFLLFDAGRIAPDDLPAHGHGDMFSFEYSIGGERMIVDQGVFEYVAGPKRALSRSAASHNTVSVEGGDQAEFFGAFRAGRRAKARIIEHRASDKGFELVAEHDGFVGLPTPVIHRRSIAADPRRIRIDDVLEGRRSTPARSALLLAPAIRVEILSSSALRLIGEKGNAIVTGSHVFACEAAVWWPDMGVE